MIVLSKFSVAPLLAARGEGRERVEASLDLGFSTAEVGLASEGVALPDGSALPWEEVEMIAANKTTCFLIESGRVEPIRCYSEEFGRVYSLMPTERAPTMLAAGFPMHRIKGIDPHEDTLRKIRSIAPVTGAVLDTATGLGYTAIEAAKTASRVVTIEIDPIVLEICRWNPWSRALFTNPRIERRIGSAFDLVPEFDAETFDRIIHDPPTLKLAGELYAGEFYRELYRVLRRGGRLFHYIGDLGSALGSTVARGAIKRLQEAGFAKIQRRHEAFGLVAVK